MISRALILCLLSPLFVGSAMAQQPTTQQATPQQAAPKKNPPAAAASPGEASNARAPATAGKANAPKAIGKFDDWTAAIHQEAGQPVCYAFTRAQSSMPTLPGRGGVVLTVTQRPSGRDAVAMEAGFPYAANATVTVQADQTGLDFYTAQRAAFARNGRAAVTAFASSGRAIARSPGPRDASVTDTFSLKGFSAAYAAINKACPPK